LVLLIVPSVAIAAASMRSVPSVQSSLPIPKLLKHHRPLALKVARRMQALCGEPLEDLEQLALIGLTKAIERYDPTLGLKFSSIAVPYIRGEIMHFLRDHGELMKVPRRARETAASVKKEHRQLVSQGFDFPIAKVAAAMGIRAEDWQWLEQAIANKSIGVLDEEICKSVAVLGGDLETYRSLHEAMALLPEIQHAVLTARFFLKLEAAEIAQRHDLSLEALEAIATLALESLKCTLKN